jgi:hypothetical protein
MTKQSFLIDQAVDLYCQDIARIDTLGPNRRLIFTIPDVTSPSDDCQAVAVKLIMPAELLVRLAYMAAGTDESAASRQLLALETHRAN